MMELQKAISDYFAENPICANVDQSEQLKQMKWERQIRSVKKQISEMMKQRTEQREALVTLIGSDLSDLIG